MERHVSHAEQRGPEAFFARVDVLPVSRDEFIELVASKYPEMKDEDITQMKGINFVHDGRVIVLFRTDIFPEEYLPYLETHEKWEAYIAMKSGYNLFHKSAREYKQDRAIDDFDEASKQEFFEEIGMYSYDFRHEFAIYKEYQHAMREGKLEAYHQWFMELRESEKPTASPTSMRLITNDTSIRKSVYKRLMERSRHVFLRGERQ